MQPDYNFLLNTFNDNLIDYSEIKYNNILISYNQDEVYDISFIIPVRGRLDFLEAAYTAFKNASELSGLNISLTISEHSFNPEHSQFCKKNKINYIWIKSEEPFNKCLAMNVAALYSSTAKYLLFHDIDCLVQKDFFINLMLNINSKNCKAIQCFHGRRVLYLDQEVTDNVLSKKTCVDELAFGNKGISPPQVFGAPGGSICIETNLFFEVGGYDPELFNSNAPEDVFFWNKVGELDEMQTCDSPNIDLFHLNHPVTYYDNPRIQEMQNLNRSFFTATPEQKKEFIEIKKIQINKFRNNEKN